MVPRFTILCAVLGLILAWLSAGMVEPGSSLLESLFTLGAFGAIIGLVVDLILFAGYSAMTRDRQHNPDPNVNAHRIVQESTRDDSETPTDLEGAWKKWSESIQRVDERGMTLLRAAFEAGWLAGNAND
jgi:hypothetical protein